MSYQHLRLGRESQQNDRHPRKPPRLVKPENPAEFGLKLVGLLRKARERMSQPKEAGIGGFDERKLLKISLCKGSMLPELAKISPGIEIVSHEESQIVIAFAREEDLNQIEARLSTLATGGQVKYKDLLYVIEDFDSWTAKDRTGCALEQQGFPKQDSFRLDIELWPQERPDRRKSMMSAFSNWLRELGVKVLDKLEQPWLMMLRIDCSQKQAEQILHYRDVRKVDLLPRLGVSVELLITDINNIPLIDAPEGASPVIGILDTGLATGHPLLQKAVGDAQEYLVSEDSPNNQNPKHGTFVAGLALYGDIAECIRKNRFLPQLRLVSAQVFKEGTNQSELVEKAVDRAVRDLVKQYGCRVFNLSYGDLNKVYDGRRLGSLAFTLDCLARELGVLFVVSTGNLSSNSLPKNPHHTYPGYLFEADACIVDPATALNVLTVGGLALHEAGRESQKRPKTFEEIPIARSGEPFPLTRCGPSINRAIKPDLVEKAGNLAFNRNGNCRHQGLGVVSLNSGFTNGGAFCEDIGTSYAAALVANKAGRLLRELPDASSNLIRALIGAHADWPESCQTLLKNTSYKKDKNLLRLVGYGQVNEKALYRSLNNKVTLLAEEEIKNDQHHFFELPLPEVFWSGAMRERTITIALAYSPAVRTTRIDYRMSRLHFSLVTAMDLERVAEAFCRGREQGMPERSSGRWLTNEERKGGTLQVSRWTFKKALSKKQKVFVVITRHDNSWSDRKDQLEPYAMVSVIDDREQVNSQIYQHVYAILEARVQARARVRI